MRLFFLVLVFFVQLYSMDDNKRILKFDDDSTKALDKLSIESINKYFDVDVTDATIKKLKQALNKDLFIDGEYVDFDNKENIDQKSNMENRKEYTSWSKKSLKEIVEAITFLFQSNGTMDDTMKFEVGHRIKQHIANGGLWKNSLLDDLRNALPKVKNRTSINIFLLSSNGGFVKDYIRFYYKNDLSGMSELEVFEKFVRWSYLDVRMAFMWLCKSLNVEAYKFLEKFLKKKLATPNAYDQETGCNSLICIIRNVVNDSKYQGYNINSIMLDKLELLSGYINEKIYNQKDFDGRSLEYYLSDRYFENQSKDWKTDNQFFITGIKKIRTKIEKRLGK